MITKLRDSFANIPINVVLLLMGTLTSWRLLAEGVNAEQGGSGACNADSPHDGACSQSKCDDTLLQRYSLRSPSFWRGRNRTTLDTGAAPKPLHLLYREYRLLNDIGAGALHILIGNTASCKLGNSSSTTLGSTHCKKLPAPEHQQRLINGLIARFS